MKGKYLVVTDSMDTLDSCTFDTLDEAVDSADLGQGDRIFRIDKATEFVPAGWVPKVP